MKILAVDDDSFTLELLIKMAELLGFSDFKTASSGAAALKLLQKSDIAFDCLLFDITMPGIDGIELCSLVRAMPAYRKTPIIMLTAMAEKDSIDRAFKAGATDYANKPFDVVELGARLRMAEEDVLARRGEVPTRPVFSPKRGSTVSQHAAELSEAVQIDGIENLIEYTALGNYLTQLSSAGLGGQQVLAVKVEKIETIYSRTSSEEFLYALSEVADAVGDVFETSSYAMAYAGNGTFVIVSSKASLESSVRVEAAIQTILDTNCAEYDNGDPMEITVSLGNPIRPSLSKRQGIRRTFDRAIARAESRAMKKENDPRPHNIRMFRS